jgi:hypothetical protein
VSPDLAHEIDPIIRRLGWKWTIALNIVLCAGAPFYPPTFLYIIGGLSIFCALWNIRILSCKKRH